MALLALVAASAAAWSAPSRASADAPAGEVSFDGAGPVVVTADGTDVPLELFIQNFASSGIAVRWASNASPVAFCTIDANRPATFTAAQFRDAVRLAAEMWNNIDAAVGVRYTGDCDTSQVSMDNRINEVGWDDARNLVSGQQAGLTQGVYRTGIGGAQFLETDIIMANGLSVPEACLRTVIAHEMGHALGFGHSDTRADLMTPSFTPSDLNTCRPTASADEATWLINLYGANRKPVLTRPADLSVAAGSPVTLTATATDPEGDALTFTWKQLSGPAVTLTATGASASFTAPSSGPVTVEVAALDRFLHRSAGTVTLTVTAAASTTVSPAAGFTTPLAPVGVTLAQWGGGTIASAAATPKVRSLWVFSGGVPVGYVAGAPSFVNQRFLALYLDGSIPAGTLLVVVTG